MKIMLQGYLHNANFGDIMSAYLFYKKCQSAGFKKIDFYQYKDFGIGSFCRKQIGYTTKKNLLSCFCSNAFVIISGGSFWNDENISYDAEVRYKRFILPALVYRFMRKPVYILGVGGGPVDTLWLRKKMIRLMNKAKVVTFRDEKTWNVFNEYGVKNKMSVTADTMLIIKKEMLDPFEEKEQLQQIANERKKLLLHLPDGAWENSCIVDKVLPGLIPFLNEHKEYLLVLSNDNIRNIGNNEKQEVEKIRRTLIDSGIDFYDYKYHDCWQMCSLINEIDCIVTAKLHVGVVGSSLGKCVVSFPVHREKTDNFYAMISESDRCCNMRVLTPEKVYEQLEKYHDKPVNISQEMRDLAASNLEVLSDIINKRHKKER